MPTRIRSGVYVISINGREMVRLCLTPEPEERIMESNLRRWDPFQLANTMPIQRALAHIAKG